MSNSYYEMMRQQSMSPEGKQAFYYKLTQKSCGKATVYVKRAVIAAVCIALLVPVTVLAVESIFGISIVKRVTGMLSVGREGVGYEITYPEALSRPLTDFAQELQTFDGHVTKAYDTWQDAEAELGITLLNNPVLQREGVQKEPSYNLREIGLGPRVHCFASFSGLDGQLYRATVTAGYRYDNMSVTVGSVVTCEHPKITAEEERDMHWVRVLYEQTDIEEITQEQYTAANGITATIVSIEKTKGGMQEYEATFSANGASYRITVDPNARNGDRNEAAKAYLIEILNGFVF